MVDHRGTYPSALRNFLDKQDRRVTLAIDLAECNISVGAHEAAGDEKPTDATRWFRRAHGRATIRRPRLMGADIFVRVGERDVPASEFDCAFALHFLADDELKSAGDGEVERFGVLRFSPGFESGFGNPAPASLQLDLVVPVSFIEFAPTIKRVAVTLDGVRRKHPDSETDRDCVWEQPEKSSLEVVRLELMQAGEWPEDAGAVRHFDKAESLERGSSLSTETLTWEGADGILWPNRRKSQSSPMIRLGRTLHWALALFAALIVGLAGVQQYQSGAGGELVWLAMAPLLCGRALRYIFSGE